MDFNPLNPFNPWLFPLARKFPPPDVVVEVDKSNQSLHQFPIYATFGVPENALRIIK